MTFHFGTLADGEAAGVRVRDLAVVGGVAANQAVRASLRGLCEERTPEWTSEVNDALRAVRRFREQRSRAAEFAPESGGSSQLATEAGVV